MDEREMLVEMASLNLLQAIRQDPIVRMLAAYDGSKTNPELLSNNDNVPVEHLEQIALDGCAASIKAVTDILKKTLEIFSPEAIEEATRQTINEFIKRHT